MFTLEPQIYFGVSPEVRGGGSFLDDYTFAHVSGRLLVSQDLRTRNQEFTHIPKFGPHLINIVTFDAKRSVMVVADQGIPPTLNVYRLNDFENLLTFIPKTYSSDKFTSVFVHSDSERISALLGPPDNIIYTLFLGDKSVEAATPALLPKDEGKEVTQIIGHHEDTFHYAILGIGVLRFVTWMGDIWEDIFNSFNNADAIPITCGTYTSIDTLLVGTADGKLMLISHGGIKAIYDALTVENILIELPKKGVKPSPSLPPPEGNVVEDGVVYKNEVKFLRSFKRGIVYIVKTDKEERLHVMLKGRFGNKAPYWTSDPNYLPVPEDDPFPKHGLIKIHVGRVAEYETIHPASRPLYVVTHLAINPTGTCIVLIFAGRFMMAVDVKDDFDPPKHVPKACMLSIGYNKCPVEHVASSILKNMFITACEKTVKLYNYRQKEVFLAYVFQDYVHSISMHPSGCFGLIGFTDRVVLFALQQKIFLPIVEVNVECCRCSTFSNGGDIFAIAEETKLRVYSVYSFKQIAEIKDEQAGKITSMKLCPRNNHIWASRTSGVLAQTNLKDGIVKYMFPNSPKASFDEYDNFRRIYFTGYDGSLEELDTVERCITQRVNLNHGNLTDVIVSKTWNLIFLGTETGHVLVLGCPLKKDEPPLLAKKMHYAPIMKIALSKDETKLFTSAKDGSVCIWKLMDLSNSKRWDGVYIKSKGFPIPSNYVDSYDQKTVQQLVDLEKNYYSRQEKLMLQNPRKDLLKRLNSLLDCLKAYELRGVLHPPTKIRRFKYRDYWHNLHKIGRDFLLDEQLEYEKHQKKYSEETQDYIDVYKYYQEKTQEYKYRYLDRMKIAFEKVKENNECLSSVIFHDVGGHILAHIKKQKLFCNHLKKEARNILKDIELKGRRYIEMRTQPSYLKNVKIERELRFKNRQLMKTLLHKKILNILKLYKTLLEARKICNEHVEHGGDNVYRQNRDNESDVFCDIKSEDPSESINIDYSYLIQNTPEGSMSGESTANIQEVIWPGQKTEKCSQLKKKIKKMRKIKFMPNYALDDGLNDDEEVGGTKIPVIEKDSKVLMTGRSFVIKEGEDYIQKSLIKNQQKSKVKCNKLGSFRKVLSKNFKTQKQICSTQDIIKNWDTSQDAIPPFKIPLTDEKYAFLLHSLPKKFVKASKRKSTGINLSSMQDCPNMFDHFKHIESFVEKISPFRAFRRKLTQGKFRNVLLNYSPDSKMSKLATKYLVNSKVIQPKISNYPIQFKVEMPLVEYNPLSEKNLNAQRGSLRLRTEVDDFAELCHPTFMGSNYFDESEEAHKKSRSIVIEDIPIDRDRFKEKKIKKNWMRLHQLAYPKKMIFSPTLFFPTTEYKKIFCRVFEKNLALPKSALPTLKSLLAGHTPFLKGFFRKKSSTPAIFPVNDIWLLKSMNVIKHLKLPNKKAARIKTLTAGNEKKYREKTNQRDLLQDRELKRTYMRLGKLDLLEQERLNHNLYPKDEILLFNPPISKNLLSVLVGTDLLHELVQSSDVSSSSKSVDSSYQNFSQFKPVSMRIMPSDTELFKNYFEDKEKVLGKFRYVAEPRVSYESSKKSQSREDVKSEVTDKESVERFEASDYTIQRSIQSYRKKRLLKADSKLQVNIDVAKSSGEMNRFQYLEYLKSYEMFFSNKKLFPTMKMICYLQNGGDPTEGAEYQVDDYVPKTKEDDEKDQDNLDTKETDKKENDDLNSKVEIAAKDGRKKLLSNIEKKLVLRNEIKSLKNIEKLSRSKKTKIISENTRISNDISAVSSKNISITKVSNWLAATEETISATPLICRTSQNLLQKDGKCENGNAIINEIKEEGVRVLWEDLYDKTFTYVKKPLPLYTPFSYRLWKKLFSCNHPNTIESYNDLVEAFTKSMNDIMKFTSYPGLSFQDTYQESLPKMKRSEDPSDEIESVGSVTYIILEEGYPEKDNYSIYSKQKMRIKTNLKNKVWFIPDNGKVDEFSKGMFYYPGKPEWHKGIISSFLPGPSDDQSVLTYVEKPISDMKREKKQKHFYCNSHSNKGPETKTANAVLDDQDLQTFEYVANKTPFGRLHLLPIKYRRFWKALERSIGNQLTLMLYNKVKESKGTKGKHDKKSMENLKPLFVTYNRALMDISTAIPMPMCSSAHANLDSAKSTKSCYTGQVNMTRAAESSTSSESPDLYSSSSDQTSSKPGEISPVTDNRSSLSASRISEFHEEANPNRMQTGGIEEATVDDNSGTVTSMNSKEILYTYEIGLEWGLKKYFITTFKKPHVHSVVKRFEKGLFDLIKEQLDSNMPKQRNIDCRLPKDKLIPSSEGTYIKPALKVRWPELALKETKKEPKPGQEQFSLLQPLKRRITRVTCPKDKLTDLNRKILRVYRERQNKAFLAKCMAVQEFIPYNNKMKRSYLPKHFDFSNLEGNYLMLKKIMEHFMAKRLRKLQYYCRYRAKDRVKFHAHDVMKAFRSERELVYRERLRQGEEFQREYNFHKAQILLWLENSKKIKAKLHKSLKMSDEKWEYLKKMKGDIKHIIDMFSCDRNSNNIRKAASELIQKYARDGAKLSNIKKVNDDYEQFIIENLKTQQNTLLDDPEELIKPKEYLECRSSFDYAKELAYVERKTTGTRGDKYEQGLGQLKSKEKVDFYSYMEEMTVKLGRQEESVKTMKKFMSDKAARFSCKNKQPSIN